MFGNSLESNKALQWPIYVYLQNPHSTAFRIGYTGIARNKSVLIPFH
jgi:hypothetical protein